MPKMGESISEATIISWLKKVGDSVDAEETILEVATDKVDSEVPSPVSGVITEIRFQKDAIVGVGEVLALIAEGKKLNQDESNEHAASEERFAATVKSQQGEAGKENLSHKPEIEIKSFKANNEQQTTDNFLSPLIVSIAQKENLSLEEVQSIIGSGNEGRIQKSDVFNYLNNRKYAIQSKPTTQIPKPTTDYPKPKIAFTAGKDRIIEMDRMRQMIADHMVYSKHTAPHVTSYIEVDVTHLVQWRNQNKERFFDKYQEKLTFTPIFVAAVAKAIQDFPMINVSVDGKNIIVHADIHIGMATALPNGNLIVPVVKNANEKSLQELAKAVNHLAESSRNNKLKPDEVQGSTFTISNVGTFGSLMGTPIINQPEVAILALGIIKKRPEVMTTSKGDEIAIRSMMYLSLSFDHRVVDGFLGGSFLRKIGDYLEQFDTNTAI